jgi:hypothetical protein
MTHSPHTLPSPSVYNYIHYLIMLTLSHQGRNTVEAETMSFFVVVVPFYHIPSTYPNVWHPIIFVIDYSSVGKGQEKQAFLEALWQYVLTLVILLLGNDPRGAQRLS